VSKQKSQGCLSTGADFWGFNFFVASPFLTWHIGFVRLFVALWLDFAEEFSFYCPDDLLWAGFSRIVALARFTSSCLGKQVLNHCSKNCFGDTAMLGF
jgi:hypothetical protein